MDWTEFAGYTARTRRAGSMTKKRKTKVTKEKVKMTKAKGMELASAAVSLAILLDTALKLVARDTVVAERDLMEMAQDSGMEKEGDSMKIEAKVKRDRRLKDEMNQREGSRSKCIRRNSKGTAKFLIKH